MVAVWAGYDFDALLLGQQVPLLDQLANLFGPAGLANSGWTVDEQTSTSVTFSYEAHDVGISHNLEVTLYGTDFSFTHNYSGQGLGYAAGTFLSGIVTSMEIDASAWGGRGGFASSESGIIGISGIDQSLSEIMATGLDMSGNDYIVGGQGERWSTSPFSGSRTYVDEDQWLFGGAGFDFIFGMDGNDTIDGGADADFLDGGEGYDTLWLGSFGFGQWVHLGDGTSSTGDTFVNFEAVRGSAFGDILAGSAGDNSLWGEDGDDVLAGGAGRDSIWGGHGNDLVYVESGKDRMDGGSGFDILSFELADEGVTIQFVRDYWVDGLLEDGSTYSQFEGIVGSNYDDVLIGTDVDDAISGGKGADVITLGGGADYLNIDADDVVAGEFDYISDFAAEDSIFMPETLPLYVFDWAGTTYAIANAPGSGYWGMAFGGGITVAEVQDSIFYI